MIQSFESQPFHNRQIHSQNFDFFQISIKFDFLEQKKNFFLLSETQWLTMNVLKSFEFSKILGKILGKMKRISFIIWIKESILEMGFKKLKMNYGCQVG